MIYVLGGNEWGAYFSSGAINEADPNCKGMIVVLHCGHIIDRQAEFPEHCKECPKHYNESP